MSGTPTPEHWLPAQLVIQALVSLAQTQRTQTVEFVNSFLNCTGTDRFHHKMEESGFISRRNTRQSALWTHSVDWGSPFNKVESAVSSKVSKRSDA